MYIRQIPEPMSDQEQLQGMVFTDLQERYLTNELILATEERAREPVPQTGDTELEQYARSQEYTRGKIEMIMFLLAMSRDKKSELQSVLISEAVANADEPFTVRVEDDYSDFA